MPGRVNLFRPCATTKPFEEKAPHGGVSSTPQTAEAHGPANDIGRRGTVKSEHGQMASDSSHTATLPKRPAMRSRSSTSASLTLNDATAAPSGSISLSTPQSNASAAVISRGRSYSRSSMISQVQVTVETETITTCTPLASPAGLTAPDRRESLPLALGTPASACTDHRHSSTNNKGEGRDASRDSGYLDGQVGLGDSQLAQVPEPKGIPRPAVAIRAPGTIGSQAPPEPSTPVRAMLESLKSPAVQPIGVLGRLPRLHSSPPDFYSGSFHPSSDESVSAQAAVSGATLAGRPASSTRRTLSSSAMSATSVSTSATTVSLSGIGMSRRCLSSIALGLDTAAQGFCQRVRGDPAQDGPANKVVPDGGDGLQPGTSLGQSHDGLAPEMRHLVELVRQNKLERVGTREEERLVAEAELD